MCVDICVDMCVDMCLNMCRDKCMKMCVDMYVDMCIDICIDKCIDMCICVCICMCIDMCIDMCTGVRLLESLADLPSPEERWLAQRYIDDPLLLNGKKFDMRLFVLVTNIWPLRLYLFPDGGLCADMCRGM